jgi:hypothetical protein
MSYVIFTATFYVSTFYWSRCVQTLLILVFLQDSGSLDCIQELTSSNTGWIAWYSNLRVLVVFLSPFRTNSTIEPQLSYGRFLPNGFQFINHPIVGMYLFRDTNRIFKCTMLRNNTSQTGSSRFNLRHTDLFPFNFDKAFCMFKNWRNSCFVLGNNRYFLNFLL